MPALRAAGFDVVAPDLPGFGETSEPTQPFSFVDGVAPLLPGHLVGNSFGGRIALATALAHPELVERLVLVAPAVAGWSDWTPQLQAAWEREEALVDAGDLDGAVEVALETWVAAEHRDEVRPQQHRALELQTAHEEPEVLWPELPALATLRPPTLVVVGDRDVPDFRKIAEHVAAETGAELAVVAGAGHLVGVERPDELNRLLLDFLA